jgi:Protein of unknown function (DUF3619)
VNEHQEHERARRIVELLDESADALDRETRDRLAVARRAAVAHAREQTAAVGSLAWAGHAVGRFTEKPVLGVRYFLPILALVCGVMGTIYWQQNVGPWSEIAEIDAALLTDELPPTAYLDKGLDAWLKRSP